MISAGRQMRMAVRGEVGGECRQTFVRKTNFTSLADNLGILFRLHYGSRNQIFKLQRTISGVRRRERFPAGQEKKSADERNLHGLREGMG
jgi:hypothetical protein